MSKAFSIGKVYLSPDIFREVEEAVHRLTPKLGNERAKVLLALWKRFHSLCEVQTPSRKVVVCRDPKDDAYLSLCAGVMADFLVTGDKDLLAVDPAVTQGLPSHLKIITPRQFLEPASSPQVSKPVQSDGRVSYALLPFGHRMDTDQIPL